MPTCNKCSSKSEMVLVKSGKIIGLEKPKPGGLSPSYRHSHPVATMFVTAAKALFWLDDKIDLDTYECPNCKATRKKIDHSRII